MKNFILPFVITASLGGCALDPPGTDYTVKAGWDHVSHPDVGPPFGPRSEEDTLDTLSCKLERSSDRFYVEVGLGYRLAEGGFYGSDFIFMSSAGVKLWSSKR
jgi:hypothetical protein